MTRGPDRERVMHKLAFITQQVDDLRRLAGSVDPERFVADAWLIRGAKYALQTAIEAMIDVAYHLSARAFSHPPTDAGDALETLRANGLFAPEDGPTFMEMIRFRNRVVHGYDRIDDQRVYAIIANELGDFARFVEAIERYLDRDG